MFSWDPALARCHFAPVHSWKASSVAERQVKQTPDLRLATDSDRVARGQKLQCDLDEGRETKRDSTAGRLAAVQLGLNHVLRNGEIERLDT